MAKERKATDKMNVALSGLDSCLSLITPGDGESEKMLAKAREYADEVREHMMTIQHHASQI